MNALPPESPPEAPHVPPEVVDEIVTFANATVAWLEHHHEVARNHGHVVDAESAALITGWKFVAEALFELGEQ